MPPPLDPDKRAAIVQAIEAGGTRNQIARDHEVSPGIVTKIAQDDGLDDAFDRASIKRAAEAVQVDMAKWKADFAQKMARRIEWVEARFDEPQPTVIGTKEGAEVVWSEATAADVRNLMTAVGIGVDKIAVLTRDDSQGLAAVDAWLHSLGVGQTAG